MNLSKVSKPQGLTLHLQALLLMQNELQKNRQFGRDCGQTTVNRLEFVELKKADSIFENDVLTGDDGNRVWYETSRRKLKVEMGNLERQRATCAQ